MSQESSYIKQLLRDILNTQYNKKPLPSDKCKSKFWGEWSRVVDGEGCKGNSGRFLKWDSGMGGRERGG